MMEVIPAIDIMDEKVVRLQKGKASKRCNYSHWGTPIDVAATWADCGAETVHIIDLDAATGRGHNRDIIKEIIEEIDCKFQVGGGIRSRDIASKLLQNDNCRIILGSMIIGNMHEAIGLLREYDSDSIVAALDYQQECVCIDGWRVETDTTVLEAMDYLSEIGFEWFLLTAIDRDGTLEGPDIAELASIYSRNDVNIIAAGGVSSVKDLSSLSRIGANAVVVGKALYEGRFSLREAINTQEVQK